MRRRLPLLHTVVLLTAALITAAVVVLGFVRVSRMAVAPGRLVTRAADLADAPPASERTPGAGGGPDRFECVIDILYRPAVHIGQTATIRLDAYPWMKNGTLSGHVAAINDVPEAGGGVPVTIAVNPGSPPGPLRDGLRGEARIETGETESLGRLLFPRAAKGPL